MASVSPAAIGPTAPRGDRRRHRRAAGVLTAAIPIDNPYCSCKLTAVPSGCRRSRSAAGGETLPFCRPLPLVGVTIGMERERESNDSLADGGRSPTAQPTSSPASRPFLPPPALMPPAAPPRRSRRPRPEGPRARDRVQTSMRSWQQPARSCAGGSWRRPGWRRPAATGPRRPMTSSSAG